MSFAKPIGRLLTLITTITMLSVAHADSFDQQHKQFDSLLNEYVVDGLVDYQTLQDNQDRLAAYEKALAAVNAEQLTDWSEAEQIAFWINAYNAFTLRAIIDNYPIKRGALKGIFGPSNSILQIPGVWKKLEWQAGGQTITLDEIEHEVLRKKFVEPRIHFAIVCASISCPDLRSEAYVADHLDNQLNDQLQRFIANSEKGVAIDRDKEEVSLSKIFDWFAKDFSVKENDASLFANRSKSKAGVLRYLARQLPEGDALTFIKNNDFDVEYLDYDWNLNEQKNHQNDD